MKTEIVQFDTKEERYHIDKKGQTPFTEDSKTAQLTATYCYYTPGEDLLECTRCRDRGAQERKMQHEIE